MGSRRTPATFPQPLDAPVAPRVDLKLGFSCNNRCRFCVQGDKRQQVPDLDTATAKTRLTEARAHADSVVLTGGEVTLRADLVDLVSHARGLGFRTIQLQTNGRRLAYRKTCEALIEAGVTEFSPALHGPTAEIHEYLTRAPGSFAQTVQGIVQLKELGQPVITNSVITRPSYRHLAALAQLLLRLRVDQFQFAFVHPVGTAAQAFQSIVPRLALVARHVAEGLDLGARAGVRCYTEAIPPCFLPGREHHVAEWIMPETRVYDGDVLVESYRTYRRTEGKAKGPRCATCAWEARCEGPWHEYPDAYGWAEFEPVADPPRARGDHLPGYPPVRASSARRRVTAR